MLRAVLLLFTAHLRRVVVSKRSLVCLLLVLGPVAAAFLVARLAEEHGPPPALIILWALQIQIVVPIVSLIMGSAVVSEEIEDRTITYLFTRPIPRSSVLFGRFLASAVVLVVLLGASSLAVIAILSGVVADDPEKAITAATQRRVLETVIFGALTYCAVFAAAGTFLKHPVIVGLGYSFAVEGFLANLPGNSTGITIQYYLKSFLAGGDARTLEQIGDIIVVQLATPESAALRLAAITVVALAVGAWTVRRKQYLLPS